VRRDLFCASGIANQDEIGRHLAGGYTQVVEALVVVDNELGTLGHGTTFQVLIIPKTASLRKSTQSELGLFPDCHIGR